MNSFEKEIKIALIGCGHIAPRWLDAIQDNENLRLVAVVDPDPKTFKILEKYDFENVTTFTLIEKAWKSIEIDAVIIITPPQYHSRYIIQAIEKNCHVLTEKPLCVNEDQLKHLIHAYKTAKQKQLSVVVNQQYRWNPRIEAIRDTVLSGKLGKIFMINSNFNQNNYHFKKWWRKQNSFISLFNWYIHPIDTMRYYLDSNAKSVRAKFICPPHSKIIGYSTLLMDVTFENDAVWHISANQESKAGPTTSGHGDFMMYGTEGTLQNTKNDPPYIYFPDQEKLEIGENIADIDNATTYPPGWPDTIDKFVDSIKKGTLHPTSLEDNKETILILFAAIRSFQENREVSINEVKEQLKIQ